MFRVSVSSPLLGGYDVPETLSYQIDLNCPIGADVRQPISSKLTKTKRLSMPLQRWFSVASSRFCRALRRKVKIIEQNKPTSDITNLADAICMKSCIARSMPPESASIDCEN